MAAELESPLLLPKRVGGFRVQGLGLMLGVGFRVWGFRAYGVGCRV